MTTTDPTAPATPGDALRWAAERITARLVAAGGSASANAAVAWLNVWARDLDAARATDPAPATPPERIAAALADCNASIAAYADDEENHYEDCYLDHASCLAVRIRRTLTGEDHPSG